LEVIDSSVAGAYKVTDKLSLGATVTLRYIHGNMTANLQPRTNVYGDANFDLDGWTGTGILGAMYEFTPDTRVGVSYKLRSMQKVKGDFTLNAPFGAPSLYPGTYVVDGESAPDLPASLLISGYHKLNDKIGLSSSVRWTEWSKSFPEFIMKSSLKNVEHNYQWKDSWTVAFGADYYHNNNWTFRVGTAYDQSPAKDPANRSNRIPDGDRIWLSAGLSYTSDNWQVDAGFAHLFMKKVDVEIGVPAEYSNSSNMYGINFQYKF
jgi:long-chain fatty acid transport protein